MTEQEIDEVLLDIAEKARKLQEAANNYWWVNEVPNLRLRRYDLFLTALQDMKETLESLDPRTLAPQQKS